MCVMASWEGYRERFDYSIASEYPQRTPDFPAMPAFPINRSQWKQSIKPYYSEALESGLPI